MKYVLVLLALFGALSFNGRTDRYDRRNEGAIQHHGHGAVIVQDGGTPAPPPPK
jgi:hypothetical protein